MKIGILTLPLHTNYGGILQAYALQTVIEKMGHEVVVFANDNHETISLWKMPYVYAKRLVKKLLGMKCVFFYERRFNKEYPVISQHTQPFIEKYIHTLVVSDFGKLSGRDFYAIVVGSDQIWRPKYYRKIETAYLDFAATWDIKRVAYAVSFGVDSWEYTPKQTRCCRMLAQKFDAVSVRESSGVQLCEEHFGVDARHVLDPTMLLPVGDYIKLVEEAGTPMCEGNLACYILDETAETRDLISGLVTKRGLKPYYINSRVDDWSAPLEKRIQPPVEQWLRGFMDATFIVTDSFHSCVFSIIFNKPFVVIGNGNRGLARIQSLLGMFGLERCLYNKDWTYEEAESVDWQRVNNKLKELRRSSAEFLEVLKKGGHSTHKTPITTC